MEKLINSIPKETLLEPKQSPKSWSGFALRWSNNRQKWLCGYTGGAMNFKVQYLGKRYVEADDPVEAVAFFVDLVSSRSTT